MLNARDIRRLVVSIGSVAVLVAAGEVRAQSAAPDNSSRNNPPQVQTEGQAPSENLSDSLDRNKGVIRPKGDVDPAIHATPPESASGTMPVIRPPGSPGGDQRIQPK